MKMKLGLKQAISVLCSLAFMIACLPGAAAQHYRPKDPIEHTDEGPAYKFDAETTFNERVPVVPYAVGDILCEESVGGGGQVVKTVIYDNGKSKRYEEFVEYLTDNWAKAAEYTYGESRSVSWQVSTDITLSLARKVKAKLGLSETITKSYSVAVKIPANPDRYSKLGQAADFHHQFLLKKAYLNGKLTSETKPDIMFPTESYLKVYYK